MPAIVRELFEQEARKYLGVADAIAVNSGTSALIATLASLDMKPGDEVITTPFTFSATVSAIMLTGGTPVFADIDPDTHLLDPEKIEVTERTKAIIPVHLFGRVCDMDAFNRMGPIIIEDTAQSFGAVDMQDRKAGTMGDAGCFSFYKTKNLSAFEGGLVAVPEGSRLDANRIRCIASPTANKPGFEEVGYNFRMPEPCALIALERLKMHEKAVLFELGAYDETAGFYPYVVYDLPFCRDRGISGCCPIAEEAAKAVRKDSHV